MDAIFRNLLATHFSDLAGLRAQASIPVSEALLNELLAVSLPDDGMIRSLHAFIEPDNRVLVQLRTSLLPWQLRFRLKLDKSVDYASLGSPKLRMWMENNRLLGSLGALFNALPEWARLYGNQLVVDLGAFARTPDERKLLELVRSVDISTEQGKVIFDIRAQVD